MPETYPDRTGWMTGALLDLPACPPFPQFTDFERSALEHIASTLADDEAAFRAQIATARVVDRINTDRGFYTRIAVDRAVASPAPALNTASAHFEVACFEHGVGVILWDEDRSGYLRTIEGFAYGDSRMGGRDLAGLKFVGAA
ncbi:MAG TPA: hypothetical protein VFE18_12755 [Phenylobacterium sp.]|jgi:hypothetical protein|uniref:hypothetical protein n=1 Tax=Phenylobacterium sp. TaxID=1871053 RepID=UPI002D550CC7|nr:hypothetical protein [Phenylobacterium sp.]HZZ69035.1 hypothetical protein [Phenylobacterium sp.]